MTGAGFHSRRGGRVENCWALEYLSIMGAMQSLITGLPPEIARRIHPDWRKNEAEYWAHRDELLAEYRDQWIGFADGRVIVAGSSPVEVFHKAQDSGKHPFVTCVGHEHEPSRMRRASFTYDTTYFIGHERILGRDVLNRLEILFRGPAREVVVNP